MKSNKQLWKERHAQGKTKLDVAVETQLKVDTADILNMVKKDAKKRGKFVVDAKAEAKERGEEKAAKNEAKVLEQIEENEEAAAQQEKAEAKRAAEVKDK